MTETKAKPAAAKVAKIKERIERSSEDRSASLPATLPVEPRTSRIRIVILQHPQEPDKELGTAVLLARILENSLLRIGLSWRSLSVLLGEPGVDPKRWGVLYLGAKPTWKDARVLVPVSRKGNPLEMRPALDGLILLDGTWSQVKALWWRNAWLLKLQRFVLQPSHPSQYGKLRKEPRKDCVSTIEAAAWALEELGESKGLAEYLQNSFSELLREYQKQRKANKPSAPKTHK